MRYFLLAIDNAVSTAIPFVMTRNARYNNARPRMILASHSKGGSGKGFGATKFLFVSGMVNYHSFLSSSLDEIKSPATLSSVAEGFASVAPEDNICLNSVNLRSGSNGAYSKTTPA